MTSNVWPFWSLLMSGEMSTQGCVTPLTSLFPMCAGDVNLMVRYSLTLTGVVPLGWIFETISLPKNGDDCSAVTSNKIDMASF